MDHSAVARLRKRGVFLPSPESLSIVRFCHPMSVPNRHRTWSLLAFRYRAGVSLSCAVWLLVGLVLPAVVLA